MMAILVNSLAGGGAERIALNLFDTYRKQHLDIVFICVEKEEVYPPPKGTTILYLTNFQKLNNPILKIFWIFISAYRLHQLIRKHNIIYIQSHLFRANFINTTAKRFGAQHFAQIISHLPVDFKEKAYPERKLKQSIYGWFYKKADEIISISKMMRKEIEDSLQLEKYGIKHRVVANPHDIPHIQRMATKEPSLFTFSTEKTYIISAGRLQRHKRLEVIIQALDILRKNGRKVELIILGDGKYKKVIQAEVAAHKLEPYIHFLGRQANPFPYIRKADIFVLASKKEGLPNIIIESLICGTPVVASDCVSGPREILNPETDFRKQIQDEIEYAKYGILYPVGHVALLAEAIQNLLKNNELRRNYIELGSNYVQKYSKDIIASQIIQSLPPSHSINQSINTIQ